jgi:Xaa-Pro aminopeptidase
MREEIVARQCKIMRDAGLDVLVAISPENFAYTVGFVIPSQPIMRWRHAMSLVTSDGRIALVIVDMEESTARSHAPGAEIRVWREFQDRPMEVLSSLIKDMGLTTAAIGLEMDYIPGGDLELLREFLPDARFSPAEALYRELREIKTSEEVDLIRRVSRITDQAMGAALHSVRAGMTEMDLAGALIKEIYSRGAENFKLLIVATGERSEYPNVGPTHRVLQSGDLCRVEIFGVIAGYHAAVCRTAVVQEASKAAEQIWQNLIECRKLVLGMIRPGESTKEIYESFLKKFGELGLPPISFVGHGIGLDLHEEPYLGKYSERHLEAGMVLGIEPLVYGIGKGFGLQCKDMVLVTPGGYELLTDQTPNERLIVIP